MLCSRCGHANDDDMTFCVSCGLKLKGATPSPSSKADEVTEVYNLWSEELPGLESSLTGRTIDNKYLLERLLGKGGMGAVYRARRLLIDDAVAIKIVHLGRGSDATMAERFRREAQSSARLKHPNAVSIYDFGTTADGLQYLVMELVEGESLRAMIKTRGPLIPSLAADILSQVASALDEAHTQNIVHRDIKPDNIIVCQSAGRLRVKVLDFGIAKLKDVTASHLTQTGSVMGTPYYMSPEQCLGEEIDARSDIYSLGVVAYEMLTGRVPFDAPNSNAVVVQHVNHPPPPLHQIRPGISPAIEAVVMRALEKRPALRHQTAGAFAGEFAAAVDSVPTIQAPLGSFENIRTNTPKAGEPTLVLRDAPTAPYSEEQPRPVKPFVSTQPEPQPPNNTKVVALTALATILLVSLVSLVAWMSLRGGSNSASSNVTNYNTNRLTQTNTRSNVNSNVASSTPTPTPSSNMNAGTMANANTAATPADTSAARTQIMALMNGWAASLRRRDLEGNMSYYASRLDVFYDSSNVDKETVRMKRQNNFNNYTYMDVQLSNLDVTVDSSGTRAVVTYDNTYDWRGRTSTSGKSHNEIDLVKAGGQWLITSEKHLKTIY
jgi:serine/threonine protein kinase